MKKMLSLALALVLALGLLAGCQPAAPAPSTEAPAAQQTPAAGEATPAPAAEEKYAMLLKPVSNEYWSIMEAGVKEWATQQGITVDVYAAESEENLAGQLSQLEDIAKKGYAGIAVAPLSPVNLISGIVMVNQAGIPIVDVDEAVDFTELKANGGAMVGQVTTDNLMVGKRAGEFIVEKIGTGKVAIIEGTGGNVTSQNRSAGAKEVFESTEGVELVASQPGDWDRVKSLDVATNILQTNPDLKAFYCANDTMALGVYQAVVNANKQDQVIVVGTDGVAGAVESIKNGELTASVAQDPVGIGIRCIELLREAVKNGWKADASAEIPVEYIDSYLITKDNAK